MARPKSNTDLVKQMMTFSQHGALAQMFIVEAITKYSNAVAASKPADYPEMGFVSPEAWIGVAKDIKAQMDAFYGRTA